VEIKWGVLDTKRGHGQVHEGLAARTAHTFNAERRRSDKDENGTESVAAKVACDPEAKRAVVMKHRAAMSVYERMRPARVRTEPHGQSWWGHDDERLAERE